MLDILAANPVLTVFLVIALGSPVGLIPFGPIRFGPAGALFVGLALGALDPRLGHGLELIRTFGLALFVYTVGLAAGPTLIHTFRRQAPMMLGSKPHRRRLPAGPAVHPRPVRQEHRRARHRRPLRRMRHPCAPGRPGPARPR